MDPRLVELAKSYAFIDLWYNWTIRYADALSVSNNRGYGYRAGVFYPNGSRLGQHHDDWPPFFDQGALNGIPYTGINALYSYIKHPSFKLYWDSGGTNFQVI